MSATQLSAETAPRNVEELSKVGRFNLRMLAEELGIFASEASKAAFMSMTSEQQADNLLKLLLEKDGKGAKGTGGGGAQTRSPTTKSGNGKTAGAGAGKTTGAAATGTGGAGPSASSGGANIGPLLAKLNEVMGALNELSERIGSLEGTVGQLQSVCAGTNRLAVIAIGAACKLAEQVLDAGPEQVLKAVIDDMSVIEGALASVIPATGDDETEAEDEGNGE